MIYMFEEAFYINVHHIMQMGQLYQLVTSGNGVFRGPVRAETIGMVVKLRLTNRLQDLQNALLYDAVYNGRDTKRPCFSVGFWDFYPANRAWVIALELRLNQRNKLGLIQLSKVLYCALVHSCGAAPCIALD